MHGLNLSIVLSFLSFNLYGIQKQAESTSFMDLPLEMKQLVVNKVIASDLNDSYSLCKISTMGGLIENSLTNEEVIKEIYLNYLISGGQLIKSVQQAGIQDLASDHLLKILEVEKILFAKFLQQKVSSLDSSVEWKKHTLSTLLSFYVVWNAALNAVEDITLEAVCNVAYDQTYDAAEDAAQAAVRNAVWKSAAEVAIERAANDAASIVAGKMAEGPVYYKIRNEDVYAAAEDAALDAALDAAKNAQRRVGDKIGKTAYMAAETQAWLTILNPDLKIFEQAYDEAYSHLEKIPEKDLGVWFSSKKTFKEKVNEYFVDFNSLDSHSKKFIAHLVCYLLHQKTLEMMFPAN